MSKGLEDGVSAETTSRRAEVALYARVSTSDKKQDLETQLMALRDFVRIQASETHWEYVDQAPANDMAHQIARRKPLDASAKKRPQRVAPAFKLDRAFRSVKHVHDSQSAWEEV